MLIFSVIDQHIKQSYLIFYFILLCLGSSITANQASSNRHTQKMKKQVYFTPFLPDILDYVFFLPDQDSTMPIDKEKIVEIVREVKEENRTIVLYGYGDFQTSLKDNTIESDLLLIARATLNEDTSAKPRKIAEIDLQPYLPRETKSRKLIVFQAEVRHSMLNQVASKLDTKLANWLLKSKLGKKQLANKIDNLEVKILEDTTKAGKVTIRNAAYKNAFQNQQSSNDELGWDYFQQSKSAYQQHIGWLYLTLAFQENKNDLAEGTELYLPCTLNGNNYYITIGIVSGSELSPLKRSPQESTNFIQENRSEILFGKSVKKIGEIQIGVKKLHDNDQKEKITLPRTDPIGVFQNSSHIPIGTKHIIEHIQKECQAIGLNFPSQVQPVANQNTGYIWSSKLVSQKKTVIDNTTSAKKQYLKKDYSDESDEERNETDTEEHKSVTSNSQTDPDQSSSYSYSVSNRKAYGSAATLIAIVTGAYVGRKIGKSRKKN